MESSELDDFEFEIFVILRKWRLEKCRSLDVEPYKIFQNRTILELIRRCRNDSEWCTNSVLKTIAIDTDATNKLIDDLLAVWGIGYAKVKVPDGYGLEAIQLFADEPIQTLLAKSRLLVST